MIETTDPMAQGGQNGPVAIPAWFSRLMEEKHVAFEFSAEDEQGFGTWLNLNLESLAWEGKHRASFDEFWRSLFYGHRDAAEIVERLHHAQALARTGPLYSWIGWLHDRFLIYAFSRSNLPFAAFCAKTDVDESWLSHVLRDYFLSVIPQNETKVHEALDVGNMLSPQRHRTFSEIAATAGIQAFPRHGDDEDMMLSMEVTLFPQWSSILKELKKDVYHLRLDWEHVRRRVSIRRQWRFVREVVLLLLVAAVFIIGLRQLNIWWESSTLKRIKLLQPQFFGLDTTLTYRPEDQAQRKIELSNEEIEKLERIEGAQSFDEISEVRFDPESDEVVLTSVEEIPSFTSGTDATSDYEEKESRKGGYRDMGVDAKGGNKAYRVLMTAADTNELRAKLLTLLGSYDAKPQGNVKPGKEIPGGIYFNLIVPSNRLKTFLGAVSGEGDATIYESNAREATPAGKNRVFIWVKSI